MLRRCAAVIVGVLLAVPAFAGATQIPAAAAPITPANGHHAQAIKKPVGTCVRDRKKKLILAPRDRNKICSIDSLVLGHAYPKPKKAGYLQKVVAKLKVGAYATFEGRLYRVAMKTSVRKEKLFTVVKSRDGVDRYLITCDTRSGYRKHHARNNLVVQLVPA